MHIDRFKNEHGEYVDADGFPYDHAESFLHCAILGFCACGDPRASLTYVRDVLRHINRFVELQEECDFSVFYDGWEEDGKKLFPTKGAEYFAYYVLDANGLTEHGSSVPGWLTPKGKEFMEDVNELLESVPENASRLEV